MCYYDPGNAFYTVSDFLKLLANSLKHKADEQASVKALSKYGALCMGDILDDWGLTDLDYLQNLTNGNVLWI